MTEQFLSKEQIIALYPLTRVSIEVSDGVVSALASRKPDGTILYVQPGTTQMIIPEGATIKARPVPRPRGCAPSSRPPPK